MVNQWDDFRRFEEMMNRMFEDFWGRPARRLMLPSGEKGGWYLPSTGNLS